MKTKEKFQIASVGLFILAVILLIPNTELNSIQSRIGYIVLKLAALISIISIFIPGSSTIQFEENNWLDDEVDGYVLAIRAKEHGIGKSPKIQIIWAFKKFYEQIEVITFHDKEGNVTIKSNAKLKGKAVIS
jgi:hypothetical protein